MAETTSTTGEIRTAKGVMQFELYDNATPATVSNFKKLISEGFYNGLTFHRVIANFMVQAGCPVGNGTGGPGYTINCETKGEKQQHDKGVMSMAHRGPDTGGSQFFICHNRSSTRHLDGVHTCFGKITGGLDVLDTIEGGDIIKEITLN